MMAGQSRLLSWLIGFYAALSLSSAIAGSDRDNPNSDWMPAEINWAQAETIELSLRDHSYAPEEVTLIANRPYKIVMNNVSLVSTHDLNGDDLFHSVVLAKIETVSNIILTPHIHSLLIRPKSTTVLYLVPKIIGEYPMYCSIPGHKEEGMEGVFIIKDASYH